MMRRATLLTVCCTLLSCGKESPSAPAEPATPHLKLFTGFNGITLAVGQMVQVPVTLLDSAGGAMTMPAGLTLSSRSQDTLLVDGLTIKAVSPSPGIRLYASVP